MSISIGIFLHKDSKEIKSYADNLFKILYRDFDKPNEKGLMIDTYFHKEGDFLDLNDYQYEFYIFLVDDNFVLSTIKNVDEEKSFIVSFTENIGNSDFNTSKVYLSNEKENIELGLFTFLANRLYHNKNMNLFLSHTKRGEIGFEIAKEYNSFIQNNTKLNAFIDINDISYGEDIKEEIDKSLEKENTIFVGFNTELYSTSKWTQYELLTAKKNKAPVIIIECFNNKLDRSFPYFGNCLVLRNKSIESNVKDILKEAIRLKINEKKMEDFKTIHSFNDLIVFNNPPELIDFLHLKEKENLNILYPEPPITDEELNILESSKHNFFTPLTYIANKNLNKKIGISISEVNGIFDNGFENIHLSTTQEEIAKYLLYTKNKIIYGGDINYKDDFNFVKILADISDKYRFRDKSIVNYCLHPLFKKIPVNVRAKYRQIIDFIDFDKSSDFSNNLSIMREEMNEICDARIMLGGKHYGYSGKYPGLLEEAYLTLKAEKPLFLIGGFGGVSKLIIDLIKGEDVEELTLQWQKLHKDNEKFRTLLDNGAGVDYDKVRDVVKNSKLNNLSDKENEILFYSKSIEEIIFYIMKGLANIER